MAGRLHRVAIHLLREVRAEDSASGLTPARLSALSVVVYSGGLPVGELARAEQVRPPTMSRLVAGLEEAGLVVRSRSPGDRRVHRIEATEAGRRLLEAARQRRLARLTGRLEELAGEERRVVEAAARCLDRLFGGEG